eukprot:1082966_1
MSSVCVDNVFGKKILQWNEEVKTTIQMENVNIGDKGKTVRVQYVELVDAVSVRYNSAIQLQQQLNTIPSIVKEIDSLQQTVQDICTKIDRLNDFYCSVLTNDHKERMMHETKQQKLFLEQEQHKCQQEVDEETQKAAEYHNILKIREIAKRKQQTKSSKAYFISYDVMGN